MPLSPKRKQIMIDIINALLQKKISSFFSKPVDPEADSCPDYLSIITSPMDLSTVLTKIHINAYRNFSSFRDDVDLIWSNAKLYNGKESIISLFADQLSKWFKQMIKGYSDDENADWLSKYNSLAKDIDQLTNKLVERKAKQISDSLSPQTAGNRPSEIFLSNQTQLNSVNILADQFSNDDSPVSSPIPKQRSQPKRAPRPKVNQTELNEIYYKILSLTDRNKIIDVIDVIDQNEPQLGVNENSEIDLNHLTMTAKLGLQEFFQKTP